MDFFLSAVQLQLAILMTFYVYVITTVATCTVFLTLELWSLSRNRYISEKTTKQLQGNTDKACIRRYAQPAHYDNITHRIMLLQY